MLIKVQKVTWYLVSLKTIIPYRSWAPVPYNDAHFEKTMLLRGAHQIITPAVSRLESVRNFVITLFGNKNSSHDTQSSWKKKVNTGKWIKETSCFQPANTAASPPSDRLQRLLFYDRSIPSDS